MCFSVSHLKKKNVLMTPSLPLASTISLLPLTADFLRKVDHVFSLQFSLPIPHESALVRLPSLSLCSN